MTEAAARISAPPGLLAPGDGGGPPGGPDLPPGLPLPPSARLLAGREDLCPPPGLAKPAARGGGVRAGRAKAYSSCSTSAASVTTEEPPPEEAAHGARAAARGLVEEAEELHQQWPSYSATISGLPNKLLTETMFEAVLEQASLSHLVLGFTLRTGRPCGEARVSLVGPAALEHCARHFQGCQWDPSGAQVAVAVDIQECQEGADWELQELAAAAAYAGGEGGFGGAAAAEALALFGAQSTAMSCEAPVFVPSAGFAAEAASAGEPGGAEAGKPAAPVTSDTSTEVGESEAEDEQDPAGPRRPAAAQVAPAVAA